MKNILTLGMLSIILLTGCGQQPVPTPPTTTTPIVQQPVQPTTCVDSPEGIPVITSLSVNTGSIGTTIDINGCNFAGFEGDKNAWIENAQNVKGIMYGEPVSTAKLIRVILKPSFCQKDTSYSGLPCDATLSIVPGTYKIFVSPWGNDSNKIPFTVQ